MALYLMVEFATITDNIFMNLSKTQKKILGWTVGVFTVLASPYLFVYCRNLPPLPRPLPTTPAQFPFEELAALDRVVQGRFAVVPDKDFGAARIGPRHEYFRPLTGEEK